MLLLSQVWYLNVNLTTFPPRTFEVIEFSIDEVCVYQFPVEFSTGFMRRKIHIRHINVIKYEYGKGHFFPDCYIQISILPR
jgi:hypothetical protein